MRLSVVRLMRLLLLPVQVEQLASLTKLPPELPPLLPAATGVTASMHGLSASLLLARCATGATHSIIAILIVIISFTPSLHVDLVGVV